MSEISRASLKTRLRSPETRVMRGARETWRKDGVRRRERVREGEGERDTDRSPLAESSPDCGHGFFFNLRCKASSAL